MSGPPSSVKRALGMCNNLSCPNTKTFGQTSKAPLKCGRCQTARYCGKECQRAHWPQHKEYCAAWSQFSEIKGVPLSQTKNKMAHFIWLLRGMPQYVIYLFKEYDIHRRSEPRGFIEFHFDSTESLLKAIAIVQSQPVLEPDYAFYGMPGSPSYSGTNSNGEPASTKLALRKLRVEDEEEFLRAVDEPMAFTSSDSRTNVQKLLDMAVKHNDLLVVSVTVDLSDSYATHMYDFYYREVSWLPELSPGETWGPNTNK